MNEKREQRLAIFADVYKNNGWGRAPDGRPYYSDSPSHLTEPIRNVVSDFIKEKSIRSVVDLGCGDFELVSGINLHHASYLGLDIFGELIAWNTENFGSDTRQFRVADIVEDDLPDADLCMTHTVLYILSEDDVFRVLEKLRKYQFVLITDGQPDIPKEARRNIDKKTDKYTRQDYYNNGFYLELPPYNLDIETLLEHRMPSGEIMRTVLLDRTK
jgi:SAM-dependent methyltransferase